MKVSIIVPVYNGEKFIGDMYNSFLKQTFGEFEIIYVDDGSTDESLEILTGLAEKDLRIHVIHQENKGICAARNKGIENAKGDYIIFLDQDDSIDTNLVEDCFNTLESTQADLAVFGKIHHVIKDGKNISTTEERNKDECLTDRREIIYSILNIENRKNLMTIWNCIYRKNVIDECGIRFDPSFRHGYEDGMFNIEYALHCNKIVFSSHIHYEYFIRTGYSTITKFNPNLLKDISYFSTKMRNLLSGEMDEQMENMFKLYVIRFFNTIYNKIFSGLEKPCYRDKKECLISMVKEEIYTEALSYHWLHSMKQTPYFLFWRVYAFLLKKRFYLVCVLSLDGLLYLKRVR